MVFQDLALWPHLTVKGNIEFGLKAIGITATERNKKTENILTPSSLGMRHDPAHLSLDGRGRVSASAAQP